MMCPTKRVVPIQLLIWFEIWDVSKDPPSPTTAAWELLMTFGGLFWKESCGMFWVETSPSLCWGWTSFSNLLGFISHPPGLCLSLFHPIIFIGQTTGQCKYVSAAPHSCLFMATYVHSLIQQQCTVKSGSDWWSFVDHLLFYFCEWSNLAS